MTQTYLSIASSNPPIRSIEEQSFDAYALETMFPKMIGYWPASAMQFEKHALMLLSAYYEKLSDFTGPQITQALDEMSDDGRRLFAPIAGELKAFLVEKYPATSTERKFIASMSSLEMQVCSKVLSGQIARTQQDVDAELSAMINSIYQQGGSVSGTRGFQPLQSLLMRGAA